MATQPPYSLKGKRVWVAGHRGMVGSALVRRLASEDCDVLTTDRSIDLRNGEAVLKWMKEARPQGIFMAAAKVGGILANNNFPADFMYDNLAIEIAVIHAAYQTGVEKLLFLGSSCIYPRFAEQPIAESSLLTGPLEVTNQWYAIAKIAGLKMCQAYRKQHGCDFISAMPTNLYGPGDNFAPNSSHVIPALVRKAHDAKISNAKKMTIWGTGNPLREFLHVDDCADALVYLMREYSDMEQVNVGSGQELAVAELARTVMRVVGFNGELCNDSQKPDGTPRKLLDVSKLSGLGWRAQISLEEGLRSTYAWFLDHARDLRKREYAESDIFR
jgi:GDP-L-fucose synthase